MDTVLFDLDGTLLPLRNESFIRAYFDAFLKRFSYLNFRPRSYEYRMEHRAMMKKGEN